jgi:hypothetical protein
MSYCMQYRADDFVMKKENMPAALQALKGALKDKIKDDDSAHWDWVSNGEILEAMTLQEAMTALRWPLHILDYKTTPKECVKGYKKRGFKDGDVISICFDGEKLGSEDSFFEAIAPYVEEGSYIEVSGDYVLWRWVFTNKKVAQIDAYLVWEDYEGMINSLLDKFARAKQLPLLLGNHEELDRMLAERMKG